MNGALVIFEVESRPLSPPAVGLSLALAHLWVDGVHMPFVDNATRIEDLVPRWRPENPAYGRPPYASRELLGATLTIVTTNVTYVIEAAHYTRHEYRAGDTVQHLANLNAMTASAATGSAELSAMARTIFLLVEQEHNAATNSRCVQLGPDDARCDRHALHGGPHRSTTHEWDDYHVTPLNQHTPTVG